MLNIIGAAFLISVIFVIICITLYYGVTWIMESTKACHKLLGIGLIILSFTIALSCLGYVAEKSDRLPHSNPTVTIEQR
jgi:hypothetical protein